MMFIAGEAVELLCKADSKPLARYVQRLLDQTFAGFVGARESVNRGNTNCHIAVIYNIPTSLT